MKKILVWLLLASMLCTANAQELVVEYACPYFSMRLPTGMRVISGDLLEALSAAAMSDAGIKKDSCLMLALDEANGHGMDIVVSEEVPKEMPKGMFGGTSEVTEIAIEGWTAGIYGMRLEDNEYIQAYLYNDMVLLWVTFCGMTMENCIEILQMVTV